MDTPRPDPANIRKAIDVYMRLAYLDQQPPFVVRAILATLHAWQAGLLDAPAFVAEPRDAPTRYTLRLGNRQYPHMKLILHLSPDRRRFLLRADAHDRHVCPPIESPEYVVYAELVEFNRKLCAAIEGAWTAEGILTFKSYLREDLARRRPGEAEAPPVRADECVSDEPPGNI